MTSSKSLTEKKRRIKPLDRCHKYALDVLNGKIIAGPYVRAACKRFCDDLENGGKRGLRYDVAAAERVFNFFEKALKLSDTQAFILHPSQCFILGNLFGWKKPYIKEIAQSNGKYKKTAEGEVRRFRRAYIEMGKGNGKTPMSAGICLYGLFADNEAAAEIYILGAKHQQALIGFTDVKNFLQFTPQLAKACKITGGDNQPNIAYPAKMRFLRTITGGNGMSGIRPHFVFCDELHEHRDRQPIELMERGFKGRKQPMLIIMTNSGFDRSSIAWEEHSHSIKVAQQELIDDDTFAYVCALDEGEDPMVDEKCWIKANPLLGEIVQPDLLRGAVKDAINFVGKRNNILRLHFCMWTESESSLFPPEIWHKCEVEYFDREEYAKRECYLGLDLSKTTDLTALCALYPMDNGEIHCFMDFWLPKGQLLIAEKRDKVPYMSWVQSEQLHAPEGLEVDYGWVLQHVSGIHTISPVVAMGHDRFQAAAMKAAVNEHCFRAFELLEVGAGMKSISQAFLKFQDLVYSEKFKINYHPIMRWMVACTAVETDSAGNQKYTKKKSRGRIDGVAALCHAINAYLIKNGEEKQQSAYENQGIIFLKT
jgi:phage terminase large subunit-like protein